MVAVGARLEWVESGQSSVWDSLLLEEDMEAFAEAFGVDERFELEAGADAGGFVHTSVVKIREVIPLS